jgi:hypothetical protein
VLDQIPDEPSAPHQRSLLSCPQCGLPCPLGFGETTECTACHTKVPLSRELILDRDRRRSHGQERRDHDLILQRALLTRRRFWRSPFFVAPISFIAPFVAAVGGYFYGYRQERYGEAGFVWLSGIGVIHLITSILLQSRKAEQLRSLLSARLPVQEGGPPSCRVCAAPLSVRPGDGVCCCDHCGADNLLGDPGERDDSPPRPDLFDSEAAYREVYGDEVNQRASRLYPLTIFVGFLVLAVLTFFAVEAPRSKLP